METKNEILQSLKKISYEELEEIELVLKKEKAKKRIDEILEAAIEARKEHAEGSTTVLSTPEESIKWVKDVMNEED